MQCCVFRTTISSCKGPVGLKKDWGIWGRAWQHRIAHCFRASDAPFPSPSSYSIVLQF